MLKIVLDTNILVSALINPHGKPAQIIDYVFENKIRLFISPSIVGELERVLSYPKLMKRHGLERDEHLLKLEEYKGIQIVTAAQFLELMEREAKA